MSIFHFKYFSIQQTNAALKVGTDAMLLGSFVQAEGKKKALDIGTGTGVLSLMQAQKNNELNITAIEIDSAACQDAQFNFSQSPFPNQIKLIEGDFLKIDFQEKFDVIYSNPPYYQNALKSENTSTNLAKHVGELSPNLLCEKVATLLAIKGQLWLIWPFDKRENFIQSAADNGLFLEQEIQLEGKPEQPVRSIFCFSKNKIEKPQKRNFAIRNSNNQYSIEYIELTEQYHDRKL
ncbi:MAG: methyltransferase [Crocinitomicaceae bacterium]